MMNERQFVYLSPEARGLTEEEDQVKNLIKGNLETRSDWKHFTPKFVDTKIARVDIQSLTDQINKGARIYKEGAIEQSEAEVKIDTKYMASIIHFGDFHLGSIYTNTNEVLRKIKEVKEKPNAYVVLMANLIDNAIPA